MIIFKPWRFYRSRRGLYVVVQDGMDGGETHIRRLSEDGYTTDVWKLADFLGNYNTKDMLEVVNPFEGVSRMQDWPSFGENNRGVDK